MVNIGADVSWLSEFGNEKEFLMLPLKTTIENNNSQFKIYPTNDYQTLDVEFSCQRSIYEFGHIFCVVFAVCVCVCV